MFRDIHTEVPHNVVHEIAITNNLLQRFSNFFQVGTIFISQNVLRTTLLLNVLSLC